MPHATSVTPSPEHAVLQRQLQGVYFSCHSAPLQQMQKSWLWTSRKIMLCFFMALLIFLDKTVVLRPVCDEMQEKGRIALGFDKNTRNPEKKLNLSWQFEWILPFPCQLFYMSGLYSVQTAYLEQQSSVKCNSIPNSPYFICSFQNSAALW